MNFKISAHLKFMSHRVTFDSSKMNIMNQCLVGMSSRYHYHSCSTLSKERLFRTCRKYSTIRKLEVVTPANKSFIRLTEFKKFRITGFFFHCGIYKHVS